jgi:hypothetical protein
MTDAGLSEIFAEARWNLGTRIFSSFDELG